MTVPVTSISVAVSMASSVAVTMSASSMTVSMPMLEAVDSHQIYKEPEHTDDEQSLMFDFRRFKEPFHCLREDEEGDEQQKQAIHETCQNFGTYVTIRIMRISSPLRYYLKPNILQLTYSRTVYRLNFDFDNFTYTCC